jgi:hypothetical protein
VISLELNHYGPALAPLAVPAGLRDQVGVTTITGIARAVLFW